MALAPQSVLFVLKFLFLISLSLDRHPYEYIYAFCDGCVAS